MNYIDKYKHHPDLVTVIVTEQNGTLLRMPNGDMINGIVFTRVTDHVDGMPELIVKLKVNLEFTEKE